MPEDTKNSIQYLEAARSTINQRDQAAKDADAQDALVQKMEKGLEKERAAVEESIELMIKKRRAEIEEHYDSQSESVQNDVKKTRSRREKARNKGMKARMNEETAEVRQKNSMLKNEIHRLFQKNKIPRYCNTWVFFALHYPRKPREILFFLACLLVVLGVLPCGIYALFLSQKGAAYLALVYVADILIFGGAYILVNNHTKAHHDAALKETRRLRESIATNEKQIEAIKKVIRKDTNETMYGLEEFDEKLAKLEQDNADILNEKKQALDVFDRETRESIRREIQANNEEHLAQLEKDLEEAEDRLEKLREQEQFWGRKMGEKFGNELGTEFMNAEKLDRLIQAFRDGAANMMEAQEMVRNGSEKKG
ncbi:MAG: hypothetical protein LUF00_06185 [Lachnospiraceae bacterium]|nr:hypothetical protein [Lachnospiraceae bacterium]